MRMLDADREQSVKTLQIYLTPDEAESLQNQIESLVSHPENHSHIHVFTKDCHRDISISIVTDIKIKDLSGYTEVERRILSES